MSEDVTPLSPAANAEAPQPELESKPAFGWTPYAEIINGRFAMIGFVALVIIEFLTGQDFFTWIGLR
ncbi:hypothetical protein IFO70_14105 [Phormidium tenue FACHB-886]|nr:hypothetical protein [Phormidium tenue FACHB-886]